MKTPKSHHQRAAARRCCEPPTADGSMRFFRMEELWELAKGLPIKEVRVQDLAAGGATEFVAALSLARADHG